MKKILFTGGAGFIGSHIVERYVKMGHQVLVIDNLSSGKLSNLDAIKDESNFKFVNIDICDYNKLKSIFEEFKPQVINHHAAQKSVAHSVENPIYNAKVNDIGLLNLIMLACEFKIERFIYVSSGGALSKEIIGDEKSCEYDKPQLESPYAITKYMGEMYLNIYSKLYDFKWVGLRYANVYGPRQIADGECGVIPIFVNNIMQGKKSVLFTYSDMPRGCTRDYINVHDVVDFNVLVLDESNGLNTVYNIGSGIELPILDIYEKLEDTFNVNLGIDIAGPRLGDVKRSVLNISKAKETFNWEPKISLIDGLKELKK